jgi:hypothetical protein
VLTDTVLWHALREKGLARARQFSWETSIRRVREIYRTAAEDAVPAAAPAAAAPSETRGAPPS